MAEVRYFNKNNQTKSFGKSFSPAINLKKHIHERNDLHKKFKCGFCGKSIHKNSLTRHIYRIHKGINVQNCDSCGKSFIKTNNLKKHVRIVHKSYKSVSCKKSSSKAGNFKQHIKLGSIS